MYCHYVGWCPLFRVSLSDALFTSERGQPLNNGRMIRPNVSVIWRYHCTGDGTMQQVSDSVCESEDWYQDERTTANTHATQRK